jgi:hypothetical protein
MRGLIVDVHFASHPQLASAGPLGMLFYLAASAYIAIHKVNFIPRLMADMLIPTESHDSARAPIDRCLAAGVLRTARRGGRDGLEVVELGILDAPSLTRGALRTARYRARSALAGEGPEFSTFPQASTGQRHTTSPGCDGPEVQDPEKFKYVLQVQAATDEVAADTLTRRDWYRL